MKLIVAIIRDSDANAILDALIAKKYGATRASTTGVFWKHGNTTLLIGVEADKVDDAIATIKAACGPAPTDGSHRATIYVINTARYEQI